MNTPTHTNSTAGEHDSAVLDDWQLNYLLLDSPVGTLRLWSNGRQLVRIEFSIFGTIWEIGFLHFYQTCSQILISQIWKLVIKFFVKMLFRR